MELRDLEAEGLLGMLDVELARTIGSLSQRPDPGVDLAIALTSRSVRQGHVCLPLDASPGLLATIDGDPLDLPEPSSWAQSIRRSGLADGGPLVLDDQNRLYLKRHWQLERDIARELAKRSVGLGLPERDLAEPLGRLFGEASSPARQAAERAVEHRISVLCGGPGTGKTTAVASILALLTELAITEGGAPKIALLAPTGKAAFRLGEAVAGAKQGLATSERVRALIPDEATTLQRALGLRRHGVRFGRDSEIPIDADIIVLDEASMVDLALMRQLLVAAPTNARLLIVGDPDQLTSVEAGSVLRDLVRAGQTTWWTDRLTTLTETYRYEATQPLGQLVGAIQRGDRSAIESLLNAPESDDLHFGPAKSLEAEIDSAARRWRRVLTAKTREAHFAERARYVVLTPFRSGPFGTESLGRAIETRLGPGTNAVRPIIIEENMPELELFNGDFAFVVNRDDSAIAVLSRDSAQVTEVAASRLPRHSPAYALSVHKSQGSEFEEVLVVMPDADAPLLTREMLYTAVSRARKRIRIVGPPEVIMSAVSRRAERFSGLVDRIAEEEPRSSDANDR